MEKNQGLFDPGWGLYGSDDDSESGQSVGEWGFTDHRLMEAGRVLARLSPSFANRRRATTR